MAITLCYRNTLSFLLVSSCVVGVFYAMYFAKYTLNLTSEHFTIQPLDKLLYNGSKTWIENRTYIDVKNLQFLRVLSNGATQVLESEHGVEPFLKNPIGTTLPKYGLVRHGISLFNPHAYFVFDYGPDTNSTYVLQKVNPYIQHVVTNSEDEIKLLWGETKNRKVKLIQSQRSPPVFTSRGVLSPFMSRNTIFQYEALWSLYLPHVNPPELSYCVRNLITQRLLWEIGGTIGFYPPSSSSTKLGELKILENYKDQLHLEINKLSTFLSNWDCAQILSFYECILKLTHDLVANGGTTFKPENVIKIKFWISGLLSLGYSEPKRKTTTQISKQALVALESKVIFVAAGNTMSHQNLSRGLSKMCPKYNLTHIANTSVANPKFENILLLVVFNYPHYNNIPALQTIYSYTFAQVIFCGADATDFQRDSKQYGYKGSFIEITTLSHGIYFYRCLSQVMKMGYNVTGYLLIGDDVLINTWRIKDYALDQIWLPFGVGMSLDKPYKQWVHWDAFYGRKAVTAALEDLKEHHPEKYIRYRNTLSHNSGFENAALRGGADIVYVPASLNDDAVFYFELLSKHKVYLELAMHTVIFGIQPRENTFHLPGGYMWTGADKANYIKFYKPSKFFLHPFKLGPILNTEKGIDFFCKDYAPFLIHKNYNSTTKV